MRHDRQPPRWHRALPAALGLGALVVFGRSGTAADAVDATPSSTTQPASTDQPTGGGDRPEREGFHARGMRGQGVFGGGGGGGGGGPVGLGRRFFGSQPEIDPTEGVRFMSEHAPKYWAWVSNASFPEDRRKVIESTVAVAYASYQKLRPDDPELYRVIVQRVEVEDRLFGLRAKVRQAPANARDLLAREIRAELTRSSDLIFKERKLRLSRLKRTVEREEKYLAADDASRNEMINRRLDGILNGGGGGVPFPGGSNFRIEGRGGAADGGDATDPSSSR